MTRTLQMKHSIRARILRFLECWPSDICCCSHWSSLPRAPRSGHGPDVHLRVSCGVELRNAESSFDQMTKHYKEAVLIEDPGTLAAADKDADAIEEH